MSHVVHIQPIDRLSSADSVITLLGALNVERFSHRERMAIAVAQVQATEEWFDAYMEAEALCAAYRFVKMFDTSILDSNAYPSSSAPARLAEREPGPVAARA